MQVEAVLAVITELETGTSKEMGAEPFGRGGEVGGGRGGVRGLWCKGGEGNRKADQCAEDEQVLGTEGQAIRFRLGPDQGNGEQAVGLTVESLSGCRAAGRDEMKPNSPAAEVELSVFRSGEGGLEAQVVGQLMLLKPAAEGQFGGEAGGAAAEGPDTRWGGRERALPAGGRDRRL